MFFLIFQFTLFQAYHIRFWWFIGVLPLVIEGFIFLWWLICSRRAGSLVALGLPRLRWARLALLPLWLHPIKPFSLTVIAKHVIALMCNGATAQILQVSQMGMLHDRELMWAQGVRMFNTLLNVLKRGSGIKSSWNYPLPTHQPQIKTRIKH